MMNILEREAVIERLADAKYNSQTMKEIFSYNGFSFWWLLRITVTETKVLRPIRFSDRLKPLKDLVWGAAHHLRSKPAPVPLVLYSLLRTKSRYFREVEQSLQSQHVPYRFATYSPLLPKRYDIRHSTGDLPLEYFSDFSLWREERKLRKDMQAKYAILYALLEKHLPLPPNELEMLCHTYLEVQIPEQYRIYRMAQKMFSALRPKAMLLTQEEGLHSYPVVVAARQCGVRAISMQHGVPVALPQPLSFHVSNHPSDAIRFVPPDLFLAYSTADKRYFENRHHYPNVRVVGQPRYDSLHQKLQSESPANIRRSLGLPLDKRIVLWATQTNRPAGSQSDDIRHADMVFAALDALRDTHQLVLKLHHGEDQSASFYQPYNRKYNRLAKILDARTHLFDALIAADVVLVATSTAGIEALLANRPLLQLYSEKKGSMKAYAALGFNQIAHDKKELLAYLKQTSTPAYRKKFDALRKKLLQNYPNFGSAAPAVVQLIREFL